MSRPMPPPETMLGGLVRLAFFNASGFAAIGDTRQAFLSSLSPLIAFLIVGSVLEALSAGWRAGLAEALQTLCFVLGQPVASHALAKAWKREGAWLRYATAMNWCQLVIPFMGMGFVLAALFLGALGPSPRIVAYVLFGMVVAYAATLNWFLAWRGLDLSKVRAVLFVLIITGALSLLLAVPAGLRLLLHTAAQPGLVT